MQFTSSTCSVQAPNHISTIQRMDWLVVSSSLFRGVIIHFRLLANRAAAPTQCCQHTHRRPWSKTWPRGSTCVPAVRNVGLPRRASTLARDTQRCQYQYQRRLKTTSKRKLWMWKTTRVLPKIILCFGMVVDLGQRCYTEICLYKYPEKCCLAYQSIYNSLYSDNNCICDGIALAVVHRSTFCNPTQRNLIHA